MNDFICVICGNTVSKRQSLAFKDGRACRHHTEAQQGLADREAAVRAANEARQAEEARKAKERRERFDPVAIGRKSLELRAWADSHCWCCGKEGFTGQLFWQRMMIASKRLELKGEPIPFFGDQSKLKAEIGLKGVVILTFDRCPKDTVCNQDLREIAQLIGLIQLCRDCAMKSGRKNFDELLAPKVTPEQLEKFMPVAALMEPVITEIATAELQAQAKLN